jgi:hypothetical protein
LAIESRVVQGASNLELLLGGAMVLALVRILAHLLRARRWRAEYDFCVYLIVIGALSAAGYVVARCGVIDVYRMRYEMLSIAGAVGIAGWFLRVEPSKAVVALWTALILAWASVSVYGHARLWTEYLVRPPFGGKHRIIARLDERGIRYGISEYRDAYVVSFLTNERIIMKSDRERIAEYRKIVDAHAQEAVFVTRQPCRNAEEVMPGVNFCRP